MDLVLRLPSLYSDSLYAIFDWFQTILVRHLSHDILRVPFGMELGFLGMQLRIYECSWSPRNAAV